MAEEPVLVESETKEVPPPVQNVSSESQTSRHNLKSAYEKYDSPTLQQFKRKVHQGFFNKQIAAPLYYAMRKTKKRLFRKKPLNPKETLSLAVENHLGNLKNCLPPKKTWFPTLEFVLNYGRKFNILDLVVSSLLGIIDHCYDGHLLSPTEINDIFFQKFKEISMRNIHEYIFGEAMDLCKNVVDVLVSLKEVLQPYIGEQIHKLFSNFAGDHWVKNFDFFKLALKSVLAEIKSSPEVYDEYEIFIKDMFKSDSLDLWALKNFKKRLAIIVTRNPSLLAKPATNWLINSLGHYYHKVKNSTVEKFHQVKNSTVSQFHKVKNSTVSKLKSWGYGGKTRKRSF